MNQEKSAISDQLSAVVTPASSAMHLGVVARKFSLASLRDERIKIAERHKPYMLEKDIKKMRALFKAADG
ncbi:MAG: hypothetical protein Q8O37_16390 [Sulfuricellaceae bacterium]|nr:hypothetical protein [Sulfuricellaceae bacterium]